MPTVKFDGLRRVEDALSAVEASEDFVGLVFVPNRVPQVSTRQARRDVHAVKAINKNQSRVVREAKNLLVARSTSIRCEWKPDRL